MALYYEKSKPTGSPVTAHPDYVAAVKAELRKRHALWAVVVVVIVGVVLASGRIDLGGYLPFTGKTDPEIRSESAAFFRSYLDGYSASSHGASDPDAKYADLMKSQLADRREKGTALGQSIDKHTKPLLKDSGAFKDGSQASKEFRLIRDSLKAGMRDAAK